MKRIILLPGAYTSPSARYRVRQFYEPFKSFGYDVRMYTPFPDRVNSFPPTFSFLDVLPKRIKQILRILSMRIKLHNIRANDIVITNRDIVPELRTVYFEKFILRKGAKLIFDFDDAIYLGLRKDKLRMIIPLMNYVVAGNENLAKYARTLSSKVEIIPTVVDTNAYSVIKKSKNNSKVTIGWSGSDSTLRICLPRIKPALEELDKRIDFEFLIMSSKDPNLDWSIRDIKFMKWAEETEVDGISQMDIGIMPLNDTEYERGKCGLKAIQYMACGIPAVVSPIGMNEKLIKHEFDGFHARDTNEWIEILYNLVLQPELRKRIGERGRSKVEKSFSLNYAVTKWKNLIENKLH